MIDKYRSIHIERLDHLVLTVRDLDVTTEFYVSVLGMEKVTFSEGRTALKFGNQKINLHQYGHEFSPSAIRPQPGSADLCFITNSPLSSVIKHLETCEVVIIQGPVERTGAVGTIQSVYFRDPDQNLLEVSNYKTSA
ncbi:MAG: VOC family protein [Leptolyngbyaceae bacterium]|nr:VOC family protein [Leptolyngbyaceae bacterium]